MKLEIATLAFLIAITVIAINGPDVQAGARSGHASCGVPELAFCDVPEFGCSEPVAACGGDERSILLADRRPVRRLLGAPFRVLDRIRFVPSRRGRLGCG